MKAIHGQATGAWSSAPEAERYERARPPYAQDAIRFVVERFRLGPESRVLDLAAGTGKLARQIAPYVGHVTAVEPIAAMREAFARAVPGVEVLEGRAESLPLPDASVDAVVVGQAWHWFDSTSALDEVTRVTTSGAGLALLWNVFDTRIEWVHQLEQVRHRGDASPRHTDKAWREPFSSSGHWFPLAQTEFSHTVRTARDLLFDRMLSSSWLATRTDAEKNQARARIAAVIDANFGSGSPGSRASPGEDCIQIPYRTEVFWTTRL